MARLTRKIERSAREQSHFSPPIRCTWFVCLMHDYYYFFTPLERLQLGFTTSWRRRARSWDDSLGNGEDGRKESRGRGSCRMICISSSQDTLNIISRIYLVTLTTIQYTHSCNTTCTNDVQVYPERSNLKIYFVCREFHIQSRIFIYLQSHYVRVTFVEFKSFDIYVSGKCWRFI